jgi:hypothetical protein
MTEESWFDSRQRQETLFHSVQGGCENHIASIPMGIDSLFLIGKAREARRWPDPLNVTIGNAWSKISTPPHSTANGSNIQIFVQH